MKKGIMEYTLNEFLQMEQLRPKGTFTDVVIVPTDEIHNSGFRCMKFILVKHGEIVGVVSGWSDLVHINGFGGFGIGGIEESLKHKNVPIGWYIDCLPASSCIHLFSDEELTLKDGFIGSDFVFYVKGE